MTPEIKPTKIYTYVAGTSYPNKDGSSRQELIEMYCMPGAQLSLVREPGKFIYETAIAVYIDTPTGPVQIGYVSNYTNQEISPALDAGDIATAIITQISQTLKNKELIRVDILITLTKPQ